MCKTLVLGMLWANWAVLTGLAIVYAIIGWYAFSILKGTKFPNNPDEHKVNDTLRISLFVSIMGVLLHAIKAFCSNLRETVQGADTYIYGYLSASSFYLAVLVFVTSTQQANADLWIYRLGQENNWNRHNTGIYRASYALGYCIVAALLIKYLLLLAVYVFGGFKSSRKQKANKTNTQGSNNNPNTASV